jgi:hypothetical protein
MGYIYVTRRTPQHIAKLHARHPIVNRCWATISTAPQLTDSILHRLFTVRFRSAN